MRRIIGIGETVLDIIFKNDQPQKAVPGGSAFNALISLGRTIGATHPGVGIQMITETGDDHIGDIIINFMKANHISTDGVVRNPGTQTHLSMAFLDSNNDAQYEFYKNHGAANMQTISGFGFQKGDIVLFGSFFAINPKIRQLTARLLKSAHDAGAILFYDINFRKSHIHEIPEVLANIEQNCRWSSIVRGSADDFRYLYGTDNPGEVFHNHIKPLCRNFICTQADRSIEVYAANGHYSYQTAKIDTVSTIGAGDNFNAGFIYALIHYGIESASSLGPCDWNKCVGIARQFSAAVCQRIDNYVDEGFEVAL